MFRPWILAMTLLGATTPLGGQPVIPCPDSARSIACSKAKDPRRCLESALQVCLAERSSAARNRSHQLIYSVDHGRLEHKRPNRTPVSASRVQVLPADSSVIVIVRNGTCAYDYRVEFSEQEFADADPGFRGLQEVEGLIAVGEGATPTLGDSSAGAEVEEDLSSVPALFGRIHTPERAHGVQVLLEGELKRLSDAGQKLRWEAESYASFAAWERRRVHQIWTDLQSTLKDLPNAEGCSLLEVARQRFVLLQRQVAAARSEMLASPEASLPASFEGRLNQQRSRVTLVETRIKALTAAIEAALAVRGTDMAYQEAFLQSFKRLGETYSGEAFPDFMLWELAEAYAAARRSDREGSLAESWGNVKRWLVETALADVVELRDETTDLRKTVMDNYGRLASKVNRVNADLRAGRGTLLAAYRRVTQREQVWLLPAGNSNRTVHVRILERPLLGIRERVAPPLAGDAEADAASGPKYSLAASHTYEFHRFHRFNIGAGILLSGIDEQEFSVRPAPRLDELGEPVLGEGGQPLMDLVAVEAGDNSQTRELGLFVTTYFRRQDRFPGPGAFRRALGAVFGFSLERPEDNLFLGFSYQPTLGIQVVGGLHWGRIEVLEDGIEPGVTALPFGAMEAPTREEWELEPFLGVVLDVGVFRRIFGFGPGG